MKLRRIEIEFETAKDADKKTQDALTKAMEDAAKKK